MSGKLYEFAAAYDHLISESFGKRWGHNVHGTLYANTSPWQENADTSYERALAATAFRGDEDGAALFLAAPTLKTRKDFSKYRYLRDAGVDPSTITRNRDGLNGALREFMLTRHNFRNVRPDGLLVPATDALDRMVEIWTDELADALIIDTMQTKHLLMRGRASESYVRFENLRDTIYEAAREEHKKTAEVVSTLRFMKVEKAAAAEIARHFTKAKQTGSTLSDNADQVLSELATRQMQVQGVQRVEGWGAWA